MGEPTRAEKRRWRRRVSRARHTENRSRWAKNGGAIEEFKDFAWLGLQAGGERIIVAPWLR